MAKRKKTSQAGSALTTTMLVTAFLMPLGALAAMQARLDLLVHHHTRSAIEVFYVAESGLEHALADLARDPWFDRLLQGPDGVVSTADDGEYPFRIAPPDYFPRPPYRYQVQVEQQSPEAVEILASGFGTGQSAHTVAASVQRSATPYTPGAAFSAAPIVSLLLGGEFIINGIGEGCGSGFPALALKSPEAAQTLLAQLPATAATQLLGDGESPGIAARSFPPLDTLAATAALSPTARLLDAEASGALGSGILVAASSLTLTDASGSGLLIVDGNLQVSGQMTFSGLVVALGDVQFDEGSAVQIDGGLLQGTAGSQLHLRGAGSITCDRPAIERVDSDFPGLLPRRAIIAGWRENA